MQHEYLASGRRRFGGRTLGIAAASCLLLGGWTYDALGYRQATQFEADHADDPATVVENWRNYRTWHPARHWLRPGSARAEDEHLDELEQTARKHELARTLTRLHGEAADPDADPESLWEHYLAFRAAFPEVRVTGDIDQLRSAVKTRREAQLNRRAQAAYDQLVWSEHQVRDLAGLVSQADRFLSAHDGTSPAEDVRRRRSAYLLRLEERDIEPARTASARAPLNFSQRRELYLGYLDKHPSGVFVPEARTALSRINTEWDKHDFRAVRDHFTNHPRELAELATRCRSYRGTHPAGRFVAAVDDLLRWSEQVTAPGEYRVVLRGGRFDKKLAHFLSRGPDLSVELEVAGVRYGPSSLAVNSYEPEWNHEFPRRIRWKLGDPVRIRVIDHDYKDRVMLDLVSHDDDPLAMQLLAGEVWSGANRLTFESDFRLPALPKVEK